MQSAIQPTCHRGYDDDGRDIWCAGPGNDEKCVPPEFPIVGRDTFPMCPRAMLLSRSWREVQDLVTLAETSALEGFPRCLTHAGARALIEFRRAYHEKHHEEFEAAKQRQQTPPSQQRPTFIGWRPGGK